MLYLFVNDIFVSKDTCRVAVSASLIQLFLFFFVNLCYAEKQEMHGNKLEDKNLNTLFCQMELSPVAMCYIA